MKTNVKSYTDKQILERVKSHARGFEDFPVDYWLIGVRSQEDEFNKFDDKFYLFQFTNFIGVFKGTTNAGAKGLLEFDSYNPDGCAVLQSDRIVYDSHRRGMSKGRMVYRQVKGFPYYRDDNKDYKADEVGEVYDDIIYAHVHDVKLNGADTYKQFINGWSLACQVFNNGAEWNQFLKIMGNQDLLTYCILKEWEV